MIKGQQEGVWPDISSSGGQVRNNSSFSLIVLLFSPTCPEFVLISFSNWAAHPPGKALSTPLPARLLKLSLISAHPMVIVGLIEDILPDFTLKIPKFYLLHLFEAFLQMNFTDTIFV